MTGVEFLTFNILIFIKSVPKLIVNWFRTPRIFLIVLNPIFFSIRNIIKGDWYTKQGQKVVHKNVS